jgi:hypothetical protein
MYNTTTLLHSMVLTESVEPRHQDKNYETFANLPGYMTRQSHSINTSTL